MIEIEKLLEVADESEAIELKIFQDAVIKNLKTFQESPTKANKNNIDAARDSLEKKKKELQTKYFSKDNTDASENFPSILAAMAHLDRAGFRISKSKMYRDRDKGMIRVNPDGTVPETEVRAYAATLTKKVADIGDLNDVHAIKTAKEVERLEEQIAKLKFEREKDQGKYIPRSEFEAELAARAAVFESGFRHAFNSKSRTWIALVNGRQEKTAEFLHALNKSLDELLTSYANTNTFQVMFGNETGEI